MLGIACAPGSGADEGGSVATLRPLRVGAAVVVALLALAAVPLFLSAAYTKRAEERSEADPVAAVADFRRAAQLNPFVDGPLIGKAVIEARVGDDSLAARTLDEARRRVPDDYVPPYLLAEMLAGSNPVAARRAAAAARALNPRGAEVVELQRRLAPKPAKKP